LSDHKFGFWEFCALDSIFPFYDIEVLISFQWLSINDNKLTNGVVAPGVVVGGILLSSDELLRVEELAIGSSPHLIHNSWLQIDKDGSGIFKKKICLVIV
jgi:hypothetical protein